MRILALLFFFLGISFFNFSQENEEVIGGYLYKIHIVEKGNTLYSIHKQYNVSIETIEEANSSVKDGDLPLGLKLFIPVLSEWEGSFAKVSLYTVEKKETLFGIAKKFNCKLEELTTLNPEIEKGLKQGQEIRVPVRNIQEEETEEIAETEDAVETEKLEEIKEQTEEVIEETVEEVEQPEKVNPFKRANRRTIDLGKTEQETENVESEEQEKEEESTESSNVEEESINHPIEFPDSLIHYEVNKGETLYSISKRFMVPVETLIEDNNIVGNTIQPGQILKIILKKEDVKHLDYKEILPDYEIGEVVKRSDLISVKEEYKVLVALPMNLNSNSKIISGLYDDKTDLNSLTNLSVSFLMGAEMALDSLEKLGLNAKVEFFDTEGDLTRFKEHLGTNKKSYDIIIGPFFEKLIEYAAQWGKEHRVPIVSVTKIPTRFLNGNPYLFSTVPSDLTLIGGMAKYLAQQNDANVVLIEGASNGEKERVAYFKNEYSRHGGKNIRVSPIGGGSGGTLSPNIISSKENYVVCLSDNIQRVMSFVTALNGAKNNAHRRTDVYMVGLKEWDRFTTLSSYYKNRFQFHFASANFLDYERETIVNFNQEFRDKYGSEPSRYAIHGYDVILSQLSQFILGLKRDEGMMDSFDLQPIGTYHGSENTKVFITKQNEFELELLKVIGN